MSDNQLSGFLQGDDEDEAALNQVKKLTVQDAVNSDSMANYGGVEEPIVIAPPGQVNQFKKVEKIIEENIKALRTKYPTGGIKSIQILTSNVLLQAPADFFDRFQEEVKAGTAWVQSAISDRGLSHETAAAVNSPANKIFQEQAFKAVYALVLEYMGKRTWQHVERSIVSTMITNEIIGLGPLEPIWLDKRITEVICNGPYDVQVEIRGKLFRVPSCKFRDVDHIYSLLQRIYEASNKQVSKMTPLVKARLSDNSRVHTVDVSVAPKGPNLNIRRHPEKYWTPQDMIDLDSANEEIMTLLGNLIYKGCSFVVVGGMSTGKTSMLNALTGFYRPDARIVTLEDSIELKPNPNKMLAAAMECVAARVDKENDKGITMRDLVKAATQMAPKVIIVGEVTDGAAYDLCQALNTGHAGASTFHANTPKEAIPRLKSLIGQGEIISAEMALPLIAAAFDIVVYLSHSLVDGSRRISHIVEVPSYPTFPENGGEPFLDMRTLYEFNSTGVVDNKLQGFWEKKADISEDLIARKGLNIEENLTWEQLKQVSKVD